MGHPGGDHASEHTGRAGCARLGGALYSRTETGIETIKRSPIIAWRIMHSFWSPSADQVTFCPLVDHDALDDPSAKAPDGTVWSTGLESWPSEEAWVEAMRQQAAADDAAEKELGLWTGAQ